MKKIVITMALTVLSLAPFAKDNFKMTGKIDGVGNDSLSLLLETGNVADMLIIA